MIALSYIRRNIVSLNWFYSRSKSNWQAVFYSKLAVMELCGWIEMSMDDVVRKCSKRKLRNGQNQVEIEKEVIKRTYGFDYKANFRGMLARVIGLSGVERLERHVNKPKFDKMVATLETLKTIRHSEAHTYLRDTMKTLDAPSVTLQRLQEVSDGLLDVEAKLRRLKL